MKSKTLTTLATAMLWLAFGPAALASFNYANTPNSFIFFDGASHFTFSPSANNLRITSGSANGLLGELTGTFTIGTIGPDGSGGSLAAVSGTGTMVIHDGANDLTAMVVWDSIDQAGTGDTLNFNGVLNLGAVTYAGSNPDLLSLKNAGEGYNVLTFQFVPAVSLSALKSGSGSHQTSFSGSEIDRVCTGEIGDFVWQDTNKNGIQDAGEPGIPGVQVELYAQGANCAPTGSALQTTTTDANGYYHFTGLCAGDYTVVFHTPSGYTHTLPLQGGDKSLDSNCQCAGTADCSVCVTLPTDDTQDLTIDCGYIPPCTGTIGDFVWNDVNGNGIQDTGEPGIPGVEVDLYTQGANCTPGTFVQQATTDANGHYLFTGLCAGDYTVVFHTPSGYSHTLSLQGSDKTVDSNCECTGTADCGVCVSLPQDNSTDLTIDCGYVQCNGTIGDYVWVDTNGNGCQDEVGTGLPGVTVNLYEGCSPSGNPIATATTDANGHYYFSGLCAGSYTVSFVTPVGYNRTVAHASCDGSGNPTPETDSDCTCDDGSPCGICVTLAPGNMTDLTIDCGYVPKTPSLSLSKTASASTVSPGQPVTYFYCVTNTGALEIDNINIVDDNGTPGDPTDDFTVNPAPFTLMPGEYQCFSAAHITEPICMSISGVSSNIGSLTINVLPTGDVEVWYLQSQSLNDNRYGTGATLATGWKNGHKFSDLLNSDEATFQFTDGKGNVVLSFQEDYIAQISSATFGDGVTINYPSGYGTYGPLGGDGKMLVGSAANVLSCRTTLSDSLNLPQFTSGFLVNSPPETAPNSNVSNPAGWDYTDGYYVKVSHNAFGANGFGNVTIPLVHNSPPKNGIDKSGATNVCNCVTNIAVATGVAVGGVGSVSDNDFEIVCASSGSSGGGGSTPCNLLAGAIKFDKNTVQIPIKDNGTANVIMNTLKLTKWPAINGRLKTVTLNGTAYGGASATLLSAPATLGTGGTAWTGNTGSRTINKGQSKTLVLTFEKNVDKTPGNYGGWTVSFGSDASCNLTIFP